MRKACFIYASLLIMSTWGCSSENRNTERIAFMDNAEVFERFAMKKDYDTRMQADMQEENKLLDSLSNLLEQANGDSLEIYKLRKDLYVAQQLFNNRFEELSMQYTSEVNERLNQYVDQYGKENGYAVILGSGGQGNVMYVDSTKNITEELILYINKKYTK